MIGLRLRPYPNRTTSYEMALVNRSGRARKATVEFYALPAPGADERESRGTVLDTLGNPLPGVKRLAEVVDVSLPADETPVRIVFPVKPAGGEKGKGENATAEKTPEPAAAEKAKPAVAITDGMVLRDSRWRNEASKVD